MKRIVFGIFLVVCIAQLAIPAWMIKRRELTLAEGDVFHCKTQPVDPYDAFRGRYVALNFDIETYSNTDHTVSFDRRQQVYAKLGTGEDGFAVIDSLHPDKIDEPCIPVRIWHGRGRHSYRLRLPMDRFYLEEELAPEAERLYRQHSRRGSSNTYAVIRVRNAFSVIEDLIIDGKSVYEYSVE